MKHALRTTYALSIFAFFVTACGPKKDVVTPAVDVQASTVQNVSYGSDPKQKMDVYLPAGRTSETPVIVFCTEVDLWRGIKMILQRFLNK